MERRNYALSKETFLLALVLLVENSAHLYLEVDFVLLRLRVRSWLFLVLLIVLLKLTEILPNVLLCRQKSTAFLIHEVPHRFHHLLCKFIEIQGMVVNRSQVSAPSKSWSLNCQHILGFDDAADSCSGSGFFISGEAECAAGHIEEVTLVLNQQGEDPASVRVLFAGIAKDIVFLTVSVQI